MVVSTDIGLHHPKKRFSPMPYSFPSPHDHDAADDSGMIPSKKRRSTIVSSCSSSSFSSSCCPSLSTDSDTNTRSTAVDLEKRVQLALQMDSLHVLEDVDLEHESMLIRQEELDSLCARDFSRLSLQEREDILHDIHGVREIIQEKPSFCQQQTRQLEEELKNRIDGATTRRRDQPKGTTSVNRPYSMALKQDESYVRSCQTMFLRASRWDPQKAADGMIGFFQKKLILFGRTALTEKITIEKHLSKSDQQALESGCFQLLPVRDNGGRAIVVAFPPVRSYKDPDSLRKAFFYIVMMALEDVETQRRGVVIVEYNMGNMARYGKIDANRVVDRQAVFALQSLWRVLPMRVVSFHCCYDDVRFRVMMTLSILMMGTACRIRLRSHFGTYQDVREKLSSFGIPRSSLPLGQDGEAKFRNHRRWFKDRRHQEMEKSLGMTPENMVIIPGRYDVLFGRGRPFQEHTGNLWFLSLVDQFYEVYNHSDNIQKRNLIQQVANTVTEHSGHFLKQGENGVDWVEVDEKSIRDKIGHAFRSHRRSSLVSPTGDRMLAMPTLSADDSF